MENGIRRQLSVYYGVTLAEKTPLLTGGTRRTAVAADIYIVFLEYGDSGDPKGRTGLFLASEILIVLLELLCGCRFLHPGIFLIGGSLLALLSMGQIRGVSNQRILYRSGLWAGGLLLCLSLLAGYAGSLLTDQTKDGTNGCIRMYRKRPARFPVR